jgi:dephospho-CoA kinase
VVAREAVRPVPAGTLPVIGLTGGIGSGKSAVARMLAEEGCLVCDSDALARQAFNDESIRDAMLAWWGNRVAAPDGAVDRSKVAAIVFTDSAERARLEALTHPWIEARRERLFAAPPPGTRALVIDAPLLLEAGLGDRCHAIVFVDSPLEMRLSRVREARGWDAAEHARRESAQWPLDRKRAAADHVVRNDGSPESLRAQVRAVLDRVRAG